MKIEWQYFGELYLKYKEFNNTDVYYHMHNVIYDVKRSKFLFDIIGKNAKKILTVSNFIKNYFFEITPTNNIAVLYNCIDFKKYKSNLNEKKIDIRKEMNIERKSYNFMFTGRCAEDKGVVELIKSFEKLEKKFSNISLTISRY